jgi:NAD+ synthase
MNAALEIKKALEIDPNQIRPKLATFIKENVEKTAAKGVVIGLSGGLDSSTTVTLCVEALGADRVLGVSMPEAGVTEPSDATDAVELANKLGIDFKVVDITPMVLCMRANLENFKEDAQLSSANIKPRVRMVVLYYYANLLNRLVVGCGNRSELRAGYFTKFGDGAADLLPIGTLYKTQLKQLAISLGVPERIIHKAPTAGLWKGQTDEDELGMSYEKMDKIYIGLDLGLELSEIAETAGVKIEDVKKLIEREKINVHKLRAPEIPDLHSLGRN